MDVRFPWVWLPAKWLAELTPRPGQEREVWGGYRERCDWSVRGYSLAGQAGLGVLFFFASSLSANGRRPLVEVMERGLRFNRRNRKR